jgi:hypothetical protein
MTGKYVRPWLARLAWLASAVIGLLMALLTSGCAPAPVIIPNESPIPLSCPVPPPIERPALPMASLSPASSPAARERARAASLELLGGYVQRLETLLDGYRKNDKEPR